MSTVGNRGNLVSLLGNSIADISQNSSVKSSEKLLQAQVGTLSQSNSELQRDLDRARKALDRQRMEHDKARSEWAELDSIRKRDSATPGLGKPNGSGHATPNGKHDEVSGCTELAEIESDVSGCQARNTWCFGGRTAPRYLGVGETGRQPIQRA